MANTSSSGGYLLPAPTPAPLEGRALLRFVQGLIIGVTEMDGNLVRPYWQTEPPDVPDEGEAWIAFKITRRPSDQYPFVGRIPNQPENGGDYLQRHEQLDILLRSMTREVLELTLDRTSLPITTQRCCAMAC